MGPIIVVLATLNMICIDRRRRQSLQHQLYTQVRQAIIARQLPAGARLPSTRNLVAELGLSRNTIVNAFDRLVAEGYLDSRVGSGIYVAQLPAMTSSLAAKPLHPAGAAKSDRSVPRRLASLPNVALTPEYPTAQVRPFRPCQPAIDQFPLRTWTRSRGRALRLYRKELMRESDPAGLPQLRSALRTYLSDARGVRCETEQITITAGAQEALSLIAAALITPGEEVWIEDPGYLGARAALLHAGADLLPVPTDAEGLTIPSVRRKRPRLIYVTPSRQFPLGTTMTLTRRLELLEFARKSGAWIIEDDYDSEFRYTGRPLSSLQGLDHSERVIYVGSFSKVLFPSLRLGYVVAPYTLVEALRKLKEIRDGPSPAIDQATAALFIEEGYFATHVRRMRKIYRERRDFFLQAAQRALSGLLAFPPIDGGMDAVGWLVRGNDAALSEKLAAAGIDAPPISAYSLRPCRPGLVLGFTSSSPTEIRFAIEAAERALRS